MNTRRLNRLYYSIPELQSRWDLSENDIRHEIANGRLVPSFFAKPGDFENMVNWQGYERQQAEAAGTLREWEDKCGPTIEDVDAMHRNLAAGLHYLHGIGNQSAFDCTFDQFCGSRDINPSEEPALYFFPHEQPMTLTRVVIEGVVTAAEVARFEGQAEWLQGTSAIGSLSASTPLANVSVPSISAPEHHAEWSLNPVARWTGYRRPVYEVLRAALRDGLPCPKAADVAQAWREKKPAEIAQLLADDGFSYYTIDGSNTKDATRRHLQRTIDGLVTRQNSGA